jgi:HSP20 family protein
MLVKKHSNYLPSLVNDFWGENLASSLMDDQNWSLTPAVNIRENDNAYAIEVAAPGIAKEQFKVDVEKNLLEISAEKEDKKEDSDDKYLRREFNYSGFKRTFSLPNTVDTDRIKAVQKDGVLLVEIPKKEEVKVKKQIAVS